MRKLQDPTVLVVDDDPLGLEVACQALRHMEPSWNVVGFERPHDALDLAWDLRHCVVVTDWCMPDLDGIELAKRLRRREAEDGHAYHVLLVTAKTGIEDMEQAFEHGNDFLVKPYDPREMRARIRAGLRQLGRQRKLLDDNADLTVRAGTDTLTGIANRRSAEEAAAREFDRWKRRNHPLSAILVDIDHFKSINDTYGHAVGDEALRATARILSSGLRPYDTLARWGGEEFLLLCPHCSFTDSLGLAERLRRNLLGESELHLPQGVRLTASFGVASASPSASTLDQLMLSTDRALYLAKQRGRNLVCGATDDPEIQTFVASGAPRESPGKSSRGV
ncbi:MAG TPA: diguanylate cyclase [Fibrobacteria bacterium]|nr:diguanylate cyclase [Fibrobacteria bacterium]HOX50291.1 diguanylate cyclase [Fibrobacteria bacterium]